MKKINILISVIALIAIASIVYAFVPPPPANQNIGINDTSVNQLTEPICRGCHNTTYLGGVPNRHHNLAASGEFSCTNCHPVISGPNGQSVLIDRNCIACHNGSAFYANPSLKPGRPHHNTTQAQVRNCKFCHGGYIDNYNDGHYVPTYNISLVTPDTSYKIYNSTSGRYWGGCEACHQGNTSVTPNILSNANTHHNELIDVTYGVNSTTGEGCTWCHFGDGALNIRRCEDCHSVATIHNIEDNYTAHNGILGFGHIGANWDCNGCHAFWDAGTDNPFAGAIVPDMSGITPAVLAADVATDVIITGTNFVQDNYSTIVVIDGTTNLTPNSVTNSQIAVTIPALSAGVHNIQLVKGGSTSTLSALTVVTPVTVVSAKLVGSSIIVTGTGFGSQPDPLFTDLGVFITHTRKGQTTTFRANVISWTDTLIVVSSSGAGVNDPLTVKALNGQGSTTIRR